MSKSLLSLDHLALEVPMMKILLVMLTVMNTYLNILTARTVMKPLGY